MASLNKVLLIGRLGQDPEKRITTGGASVASMSLATSEKYTDKQGVKQEKTEWHKLVMWNQLADLAEQYLRKGSQIYIEGSNQTREWQDKDGNKRYTTEVVVKSMQFLDSKGLSGQQPQNNAHQPDQQSQPGQFIEDDIPF